MKRAEWTDKVEILLELLVRESGLIQPEGDRSYILPHLTFEEYLAACHFAEQEDVEAAHARWREGGERWREPLLLLMGRLRMQGKHRMAFDWLKLLIEPTVGTHEKSHAQRQRDAVFAAACYREVGGRSYLLGRWHEQPVVAFEQSLRQALVNVLSHPTAESMLPLRIEAGTALGQLDDPRFPVTGEQWQAELDRRNECFGHPAGYWCYVREGSYRIGGWAADEPAASIDIPAFWLARYPLTVAQYAPFVEVGYGPEAERWWTPNGWQWKQEAKRTHPSEWGKSAYNGSNQPVIGITWYEVAAYCAWLSEQIHLTGYVVRLPTEAESEAASAYDEHGQHRNYPWGEAEPTPELAVYDASKLGRTASVGCCPAGAAPCGALDLAGNVWEWTCSHWEGYPVRSGVISDDFVQSKDFSLEEMVVPLRGGGWGNDSSSVRCGARSRLLPDGDLIFDWGFRVILAPLSIAENPIAENPKTR